MDDRSTDAGDSDLRARLAEAEDTLRAIRSGEVDAVVVHGDGGDVVYTLASAEQPYRALVEQMQEGAAILTVGGDVLYCNRRFAELVALPLEEVIGGSVERFFAQPDSASLTAIMRTDRGTHRGRLLTASGQQRDVYLSLTSAVTDGVERRYLIVADLSELVDAQSERDRAARENRAKDEFIAMLGHELRNPLGAIAGAVQVLDRVDGHDGPAAGARGVIARQVKHLSRIIGDLLDVGRLVSGKLVLMRRPLELGEAVRRGVATIASADRISKRIDVETESVWINGDSTRIEQIVANLVGNAIRYTDDNGHIRVTLSSAGEDAVLRVADDGCGIDRELLPRIFDLFVQGNQTIARTGGGLGIGLNLVQRLVALHGGTVSAASDGPGRGSTFTVRLPCEPRPASVARLSPHNGVIEKRRVLVVEDNADVREMYRMLLELNGHEVLVAGDAGSGLDLMAAERPDLALIDIGLPGVDGFELARRIRADARAADVVLVALTGYGSPEDRERAQKAGFDHHLVKPVSPETLRSLLNSPGAQARAPQ
jgi:PAS domain S-box-containing protein